MLLTIFTPTYNRKDLIERLYQSLLLQTQKNFEWLVIDDGSSDGTELFFNELLARTQPFPIRYIKQKNGGKHRAINKGVPLANGELFFIVDSDDYLLPETTKQINQWIASLDGSHKWAGIAGLRGFSANKVIGQRNNSKPFIDAKNTERRANHLKGDKAEIYFTDVLRKYPFPEIPGENFISEEIIWNAIARDNFYIRWFNEIIYISNYLDGGLTKDNSKDKLNPQGRLLWAKGQLISFPHSLQDRILAIGIYRQSVITQESIHESAKKLSISSLMIIFSSIALKIRKLLQ